MTKRIKVRGDDVKRMVDMLVEEATDDANEHRFALDQCREEIAVLQAKVRELRSEIVAMRDAVAAAEFKPIDNG